MCFFVCVLKVALWWLLRSGIVGWKGGCMYHRCVCAQVLSCVRLTAAPRTTATRLLCPWDSPGEKTGAGCPFPPQGSNLHSRWILSTEQLGKPREMSIIRAHLSFFRGFGMHGKLLIVWHFILVFFYCLWKERDVRYLNSYRKSSLPLHDNFLGIQMLITLIE